MQKNCEVTEYTPSIWRKILIGSLFVSALFFILFVFTKASFMSGFFRLFAFAGFALMVLSYLQIRGELQEIELQLDEEHLTINYFGASKKNQEELFDVETIADIRRIENPPVWKILPRSDCSKFQISFTDSKKTLSLLRFEGRDLCVSHPDARKIEGFLAENSIAFKS